VTNDPKTEGKAMKKITRWQNKDFSSWFLSELMSKKSEIEKALSNLMERQKEYRDLQSSDDFKEEGDYAEREISLQKHYNLLERKNRELKEIDILIRKALNDQQFGICEECGKQIPVERLLIVPDAIRCVPCQRDSEKFCPKGSIAQRSYNPSKRKKDIYWEATADFDDEDLCLIETDMDYMTFVDLEDTDLDDGAAG
jgi:RNA polymerase-binding transcription factor